MNKLICSGILKLRNGKETNSMSKQRVSELIDNLTYDEDNKLISVKLIDGAEIYLCKTNAKGLGLMVYNPQSKEVGQQANKTQPIHDPVNHPQHYTTHPSGVECIEITRHFNFNLGNAIKYIWRSDLKGNRVEDLKKAIFYLNNEIERINK